MDDAQLLAEQLEYYRVRAPEYDRWWHRTHQYELTPDLKAEWDAEVAQLERAVADLQPTGHVLELACGTGLWTEQLVRHAAHVTAVDGSPETLAINRARLPDAPVTYVEADLFDWEPEPRRYDDVFFSFWLSHVPPSRWADFWAMVSRALVDGGRAIFVDNRFGFAWRATPERPDTYVEQRTDLSDRSYLIVKRYFEPEELAAALDELGWRAHVRALGRVFVVGWATPPAT